MTESDFEDMKSRYLEHLQNDSLATVVYRMQESGTAANDRFGYVTNEHVAEYELRANIFLNPSNKVKASVGVSADATLIVLLATQELEEKELTVQRETAVIQYGSQEYEILNVHPKPVLFNSSVITVLGCKVKEPLSA